MRLPPACSIYAPAMTEHEVPPASSNRRDRSVARVLDPARQRAEERVQRFLDAALELLAESGSDFTLQDVVERSGLSLRSFYQYFGGKHELLLALFEDTMRETAAALEARLRGVEDPLERLHTLVVEYHMFSSSSGGGSSRRMDPKRQGPQLSQFGQLLLSEHPLEATTSFVPVRTLFEQVLADAVEAGVIRGTPRARRRAALLLQTVNFNSYVTRMVEPAATRREERAAAEEVWDLLFHGLRAH